MDKLQSIYDTKVGSPSDINEHLPTLKRYAEECDTVVEMGVRTIVSTWAFLLGNPKKLISVDYKHPSEYNSYDLPLVESIAREKNIGYEFILSDSRTVEIPECDLLFIDTLHTYHQIKKELEVHHNKVKKYLVFHDTVTFRTKGETPNEVGIWPAIEEFLLKNSNWQIHEVFQNNNGLTILKKN